jgi:DNA-binding GntR family transcriptional regulator
MNQKKLDSIEKASETISDDVERVRAVLQDKARDLLLFDLITQTGLELKQILPLKLKDLRNRRVGERILVGSEYGTAPRVLTVSQRIYDSWQKYLRKMGGRDDDYLIRSRKGGKAINLSSASHLIHTWLQAANLSEMRGSKALRKNWQIHFNTPKMAKDQRATTESAKPPLEPIESVMAIHEIVHEKMLEAIISGRFRPGERITIENIAKQMNVSRMPVRDAFLRLHQGGFISSNRKTGTIVKALSLENFNEITQIRLLIETEAAEKAAANADEEIIHKLEDLQQKWVASISHMGDLQGFENFMKLNRQFHHAIYRAAHMPILNNIIESLWDRISPYLFILIDKVKGSINEESIRKHQGMLEGMKRQDGPEVSKWVRKDLTEAAELIIRYFEFLEK